MATTRKSAVKKSKAKRLTRVIPATRKAVSTSGIVRRGSIATAGKNGAKSVGGTPRSNARPPAKSRLVRRMTPEEAVARIQQLLDAKRERDRQGPR